MFHILYILIFIYTYMDFLTNEFNIEDYLQEIFDDYYLANVEDYKHLDVEDYSFWEESGELGRKFGIYDIKYMRSWGFGTRAIFIEVILRKKKKIIIDKITKELRHFGFTINKSEYKEKNELYKYKYNLTFEKLGIHESEENILTFEKWSNKIKTS